jgi:hypothetical protein
MPDGRSFSGASGLKAILRAHEGDFRRCLVEKMLIYALGRGLDYRDVRTIGRICDEVRQNQDRFSSLILAIASSDLFEGPAQAPAPVRSQTPTLTNGKPATPQAPAASVGAQPAPASTSRPKDTPS